MTRTTGITYTTRMIGVTGMTVKTMVTRMIGMTIHNDKAVLDFQKKMFSFLVARTSILFAKNYI